MGKNKTKLIKVNYEKRKKKNLKEYSKLIIFGCFLLTILIGTSYGLLSSISTSKKKVDVVSGTLKIEYQDGNNINMTNASPLTDAEGLLTDPYTFTVKNTGTLDGKYNVSIEEKDGNTLDKRYVKYSIKEGDGEWSTPALLNTGLILTSNKILQSGEEKTYQLRFWLDENAGNDVQGQTFSAKIVVNTVQTNAELKDIESPIIILSGNSTVNIDKGETFIDPGISEVVDKDEIATSQVTTRYEYYDGQNYILVDAVDTTKTGIYYIYYEVVDKEGNKGTTVRVVNVNNKDENAPQISLIGDEVTTLEFGEKYVELGAMAQDEEDGVLTDSIIITGTVNENAPATYIIKYVVVDSNGNTSSITREVIVKPKEGTLDIDLKQDNTDNTKTEIDVSNVTDSAEVKYAITTTKDKPSDSQFKTLEELKESGVVSEDGKIVITKNGEYYIWIKDKNGNIKYEKIVVTSIDETTPVCVFEGPDHIGKELTRDYTLICTDVADMIEKRLTRDSFKLSNGNGKIQSVSSPVKVEGGYKYTITVKGVDAGTFNITLPKDTLSDKAGNKNNKTTSNDITVSSLDVNVDGEEVTDKGITIDTTNNIPTKIEIEGVDSEDITFTSDDETIVKVEDDGTIIPVSPGETYITIIDNITGIEDKIKVTIEMTVKATYELSGSGVASTTRNTDTCKLTKDNPTSCTVKAPEIKTREGYTAVGWNVNKQAHEGSYELTLTEDTTFYTISSKDAITLTAKFDANGAVLSDDEDRTCTLNTVYNDEAQLTSCTVVAPTITGSTATPIVVGFSEEVKDTTSEDLLESGGTITLTATNNKHTWYAITKNDPITYEAEFDKNGVGVDEIGSTKASCTITATYNGTDQKTSCEIELPTITQKEGYTALGWNEDKEAHEGSKAGEKYTLTKNITLYAISKKNEVTYTATFVKSGIGVTKIGGTQASCVIDEVYNNDDQATTCHIDLPSITTEGLWKVLGWSEISDTHTEYATIEDGITLTKSETTLYSITKKDELNLSASFNANGANLSTIDNPSCTLEEVYNNEPRNDYCIFSTPIISRDNFDIIGYNQDKDSHENDEAFTTEGNQIKIDSNNTDKIWYAITKRDLEVAYNKNGATEISKEKDSCTIWNSAVDCAIKLPTITRDTFDIIGWNENKDADITSTDNLLADSEININDNKEYYAITKKDVTITFDKNNSIGQTNTDGSIDYNDTLVRECTIKNREETCNIESPSIIAPYATPIVVGYGITSDSQTSSWDIMTEKNVTESVIYYAVTKNEDIPYKADFVKQGLGVESIGATTISCTIPATYNGAEQDKTCSIDLPSIKVAEGYTSLGWSTNKDTTTDYITLDKTVNLDKDMTFYAISKKDEIVLTATFHKNGAISQTYYKDEIITTSEDEKIKVSCLLEEAFNDNVQATECSITSPIINASDATPDVVGYAKTETATISSLEPNTQMSIEENVEYYAITKKDAVTFSADFDANNSEISSTDTLSCRIGTTYNGNVQATSCTVDAPTITANKNTPTIVGYNTESNATKNSENYDLTSKTLTLNKDNTGKVWYAITKKNTVTYTVNYKVGNHVTSISKTSGKCIIPETYNGEEQTTVCIIREDDTENNPIITPDTGYTSLGWNQESNATSGSPAVVLSKDNMTYYAHASANHYNINYYSDDRLVGSMSVTYDEPFKLLTLEELILIKRGYTFNSWVSAGVNYTDGEEITKNLATEEGANVRFDATWDDFERPECRFVQVGTTTTQNQTTVKMECTDTGSGVAQKTLKPEDFIVSNTTTGIIDAVSAPTAITDGFSYELTVRGLSVGTFNITIPANKIVDNSNVGILETTTPTPVTVNGRVYTVTYTKGANVDDIGTTVGSCVTEGPDIVCNVVLPSITASKGYTAKGWLDEEGKTGTIGSLYELDKERTTLTATSEDITPPKCTISGNPTSWTQSATLTVNATDEGSGLSDTPYSWTSSTEGFGTTTTKTIATNGEYKAYAKDKDGNVGECSVTADRIDTTKPTCEFSNISDTSIVAGNTATIDLTCTDTQSLISADTTSLTTASFITSTAYGKVTKVSAPTSIANGYKYTLTVEGVRYGEFTVILNANTIRDNANNYNVQVTSGSMTAYNLATVGSCNNLTYNGSPQTLVANGTGITYSANNTQTNANKYTVTMTPSAQYKYSDEATSKNIECTIKQRDTTCTSATVDQIYNGKALTSSNGSCTNLVSGHDAKFTNTGTITNVASVDAEQSSTDNTVASVTITDANSSPVTTNYNITTKPGTLTIKKATPTISLTAKETPYTGDAISANAAETNSNGAVSYVYYTNNTCTTQTPTSTGATAAGGAPKDAGQYYVKATVARANNYYAASTGCISHKINPKSVAVTWGAATYTFTYDGSAKPPVPTATTGITGETMTLARTTATNASSTAYTSTASCSSVTGGRAKCSNYTLTGTTKSYTINQATPTLTKSASSGSASTGSTATFTVKSNVAGTYTISSGNTTYATASLSSTAEIAANTNVTATVKAVSVNSSAITITVNFKPKDTTNYKSTSTTYSFTPTAITRTVTINANGNTISTPAGCTIVSGNTTSLKISCSCKTTGTSTSCSVTLPTITAPTNTPTICGYTTSATGTTTCNDYKSGATIPLSSSPNIFAQTYKSAITYTLYYSKTTGVANLSKGSDSCTINATYNGTAQTATTCTITLPSTTYITTEEGYSAAACPTGYKCTGPSGLFGFYIDRGTNNLAAGSTVTMTASYNGLNAYYYPRYVVASEVSYSNSKTGVSCTTAQCMVDQIVSACS